MSIFEPLKYLFGTDKAYEISGLVVAWPQVIPHTYLPILSSPSLWPRRRLRWWWCFGWVCCLFAIGSPKIKFVNCTPSRYYSSMLSGDDACRGGWFDGCDVASAFDMSSWKFFSAGLSSCRKIDPLRSFAKNFQKPSYELKSLIGRTYQRGKHGLQCLLNKSQAMVMAKAVTYVVQKSNMVRLYIFIT